ncbi:MAG: hypothetical protein ABSC42_10715 [Tepidisphaeraceae bacterium]|jgi:hypothetical protein
MPKHALPAALLVLVTLILSVAIVVAYLDLPADQTPVVTASTPPPSNLPIPLANFTGATEADEVFASICANYPDVVAHASKAVLVRFHTGTQMNRAGPGGKGPMPGAYSPLVQWCHPGGGIGFWGIYEYWSSGSYVAVYRLRPLDGWNGIESCTLEIQSNGGNNLIASYVPKPAELKPTQWVDVPVAFTLPQRKQIEFRFWAGTNGFAVDRIYLFRLP